MPCCSWASNDLDMSVHPNFSEFTRLARQGNVVPLYKTVIADLLSPGAKKTQEYGNIFEYLRRIGARYHPVAVPGLPPFSAGAVGYLAYEVVRELERLPPRVEPDVDVDDAVFMYFADMIAFDHVQ